MALPDFDAPIEFRGRVFAEVESFLEGHSEALVEALLVEVEGGFEGGGIAG